MLERRDRQDDLIEADRAQWANDPDAARGKIVPDTMRAN
jgi:hypothetical protein